VQAAELAHDEAERQAKLCEEREKRLQQQTGVVARLAAAHANGIAFGDY
jgi:hypothetical protein